MLYPSRSAHITLFLFCSSSLLRRPLGVDSTLLGPLSPKVDYVSELVMLLHPLHPLVATIPSSRLKLQPHTGLRTHYHVTTLTSVQMVVITKVVMLQF